ncbi:MAG: hypothetical protein K2P95_06110, partial [Hyphomonadaceae bacterium]|nr:hypothetical protein [Hyphomonadaceae bacterium]
SLPNPPAKPLPADSRAWACHTAPVAVEELRFPDLWIATLNAARGVQLRRNWALGAVNSRQLEDLAAASADAPADVVQERFQNASTVGTPASHSCISRWREEQARRWLLLCRARTCARRSVT